MKASSNLFVLILATSVFTGCIARVAAVKAPDLKAPDFKMPELKLDPKTAELLALMHTCDKKDSELSLSQFDPKETVVVKDKIDSMDIAKVACDGSKTSGGHGPVRYLNQFLTVEAPADLKEKINFVQIENFRTCSTQKLDAIDDSRLEETRLQIPDQEPVKLRGPTLSAAGFSGRLKILLSDSVVKLSAFYLNVHDNNNVLKISYYGKCLKYKDVLDQKLSDADNCSEAELLGEIQMLVSIQVERNEVSGVYEQNVCTK